MGRDMGNETGTGKQLRFFRDWRRQMHACRVESLTGRVDDGRSTMTNRSFALTAFALLALTGCGKKDEEPKTAKEVIAEAGELAQPQPGQYETQVKLLEFSVPGIPPEQADRLKSMMGNVGDQASSYCLTPEEAKKGFEESIRKMSEGQGGMNCKFTTFDVDNGKLNAEMTCDGQQGMNSTMKLAGTATAQSTSMRMAMTQKAAIIPGGEMRMEMQMDSKRTGECAS